jgi:hypothetical protein
LEVTVRLRVVLAVFAALAVLAAIAVYYLVHSLGSGLPLQLPTQECVVTANGKATFEPEQVANAATIAAVGIRRDLPTDAIVVALATAEQESKLQNVQGGDLDSVGLFQQRPSQGWGDAEQIMDPRYAAGVFYNALLKVKGWQQMTVAQAAQAVQKSADGSLYARWEGTARILTRAFTGDVGSAVGCTIVDKPAQTGTEAASALADGVTADWGEVRRVNQPGLVGVALAVDSPRTGWQYAHWLVAHAADRAIHRVRFGNQVWTANSASWSTNSSAGTAPTAGDVIAEVYA